jgi:hypothetical protein
MTANSNSLLPNTASNDIQQHVNSANSGNVNNDSQSDCHSDSDSCAPEVMVPDARVFSSIKNEQICSWLYNSVVHQGYLCKFCELFCGHSSSSQEWPNDPAKDLESWFSKARKILNFQYINWPTEEDIEL